MKELAVGTKNVPMQILRQPYNVSVENLHGFSNAVQASIMSM